MGMNEDREAGQDREKRLNEINEIKKLSLNEDKQSKANYNDAR